MNIQSALKENDRYNGFTVIDVTPLEAYNAVGILLVHDRTGLQVFHILNDDAENLFAFSFATPPSDSTGVAHILEHSVLCGSEKYPLKDPFVQLCSQSVKTFLNAMTFSDKTVYPASSISRADYFNLMSVYGDAVFFPRLDERIFRQEAHRLEFDRDGKLTVQGVVYNEMRGNYSSFENIVSDTVIQHILPGTPYAVDSGGDPDVIPDLTYGSFKSFYAEKYTPANCRLFLCGNIPTETQLDFISAQFLDRIPGSAAAAPAVNIPYPPPQLFAEPRYISCPAPETQDGNTGATVSVSWLAGDAADPVQYMEAVFVGEILLGHDGSPLSRALLESGLGEDIAPNSGLEGEMRYLVFSAGMRGMKKEDNLKLETLILSVLSGLYRTGIAPEDIEAAVLAVEFADREVRRANGPYSLVLMRRSLRGWLYGKHPAETLRNREAFAAVKKRLAADPDGYVKQLLRRLFIDNSHRLCTTVYPSAAYEKERQDRLEKRLASYTAGMSGTQKRAFEADIRAQQEALAAFQQTPDSAADAALIPHLALSDLNTEIDRISTEIAVCGHTRVYLHNEAVNGIVYMEFGIPVDILSPEEYKYLPFYALYCTNCGFDGLDWAEAASLSARLTGSFGANLFTSSTAYPLLKKLGIADMSGEDCAGALFRHDPAVGRHWLFFRIKMLEEQTADAVAMLFRSLHHPDFSDTGRMRDLLAEFKNDFAASIVPAGNEYAASRASCCFSRAKAADEIWNGLSQFMAICALAAEPDEKIGDILKGLHQKLFGAHADNGAVCNITAGSTGLAAAQKALSAYIRDIPPLRPPFCAGDSRFYAQVQLTPETGADGGAFAPEIFPVQTQVGFAAAAFPASPFGVPESVYESIAAHWLTNTLLWERIRTAGGAYGAFALPDSIEHICTLASYRDPSPGRTLEEFAAILQQTARTDIDRQQLERVITGTYSKEVQPRSPSGRGFTGFVRHLYGIEDCDRENKLRLLLSASAEDIQKACSRFLHNAGNRKTAVIFRKTDNLSGKTILLPL